MLETLATDNSVASFYRGVIASQIAARLLRSMTAWCRKADLGQLSVR